MIRTAVAATAASILLVASWTTEAKPLKTIDESISGRSLKVIQIALPKAQKENLNLDLYRITVTEDNGSIDGRPHRWLVVSFIDIEAPAVGDHSYRGDPGRRGVPGFEVTIDAKTLKIVNAHYIR